MSDEDRWQHEFVPDETFVAEGLPPEGQAELDGVIRGLLDLAELRLEAGKKMTTTNRTPDVSVR